MKDKKGFLFYYNWEEQLLRMNLEERWSFIYNLIKFHTERELSFTSEKEEMAWIGIQPALLINIERYKKSVERSRENGRKHVGKNKLISEITQQVILEPTEPDKSKQIKVNSKQEIDNSKKLIDNREETIDNSKKLIDNSEKEIEVLSLFEKLDTIIDWQVKLLTNGTGYIIDELLKSYNLTIDEMNEIIKLYNEVTSQRDSD